MPLKYPLHLYDDSGRMKPPLVVYVLLLFVCRGLILLIISLSFREDSERLLRVFYPLPYHFYLSLIPILPAILALYLVSKRNSLWEKKRFRIFKTLPVLMFIALLTDVVIQIYMLNEMRFAFSMSHGLSIVISFIGIMYLARSQYIKNLIVDWQTP
jgi:hypothetical protein